MDLRLIDKRIAKRNLAAGKLSTKEYASYLESLPDVSEKAEAVEEKLFGDADEEPTDGLEAEADE
jgi:hypothetical protein